MTEREINKIAQKWANSLRAISRKESGELESTALGYSLECTIRDAIKDALNVPIDTSWDDVDAAIAANK